MRVPAFYGWNYPILQGTVSLGDGDLDSPSPEGQYAPFPEMSIMNYVQMMLRSFMMGSYWRRPTHTTPASDPSERTVRASSPCRTSPARTSSTANTTGPSSATKGLPFSHAGKGPAPIGALGHWGIGALGHWGIGALGHWGIGALGHWEALTRTSDPYEKMAVFAVIFAQND
ncbi:MAG: hypothetical protein ACYCOU_03910 [Sulfobacillus sp.]